MNGPAAGQASTSTSRAVQGPEVSVSVRNVHGGGVVAVRGRGWTCAGKVDLTAYVDGVSPYGTAKLGYARAKAGSFSRLWRTPRVVDSLSWTVQAAEACAKSTPVAFTTLQLEAVGPVSRMARDRSPQAEEAPSSPRGVDARGLQFIADQEGYRLNSQGQYVVYNDVSGFCTAGYGHLLRKSNCTAGDYNGTFNKLSPAQAASLLQKDANKFASQILANTSVALTQDQLDSLVDFDFNCGGYVGSTLRKLLNNGQYDAVPTQLARWVHGVVGKGANRHTAVIGDLVRRRGDDTGIWKSGKFPAVQHHLPATSPAAATTTTAPARARSTTTTTPVRASSTTTTSTGDASCAKDNTGAPAPSGCARITVQVVLGYYPGDTSHGLGVGVGTATVEPGGAKVSCLKAADAGACTAKEDVPAGTSVTVSETPGSESPDPSDPPDSTFEKFTGGCSGTGTCTLTPPATGSTVDVYFIPAVVTLTLNGSPGNQVEMTANSNSPVASLDPYPPVYCPGEAGSMQLPCTILARLYTDVTVEADDTANPSLVPTFSGNCPARANAPTFCDVTMTDNHTVTATFAGS